MKPSRIAVARRALLAAASTASLASGAAAQQVPVDTAPDLVNAVVPNTGVTPGAPNTVGLPIPGSQWSNSPQVLDPRDQVNGVGQQIAFNQSGPASAGLGLCTGSLINPRAVITAAHCVYSKPAHQYGSNTGTGGGVNGPFGVGGATLTSKGAPISFGFSATNRCLGVAVNGCAVGEGAYEAWRNAGFQTVTSKHIYNGNQVWYGLTPSGEFANRDIGIVTLDTHAKGIPTWTMLFSPLDGPTHVKITGYGGTGSGFLGNNVGIDYRRRSAENMIDALMTYHDFSVAPAIGGPGNTINSAYQHSTYWMDFDDPAFSATNLPANFFKNTAPAGQRNNGYYDFNALGGPGGTALPLEGTTAGGDSGGPLIVDRRWEKSVIAGVLTGSISYNGGIATYGSMSVYPPLFLFWEDIVQNNPYVYASAKEGSGNWFDAAHWVQDMDPNYAVIAADGSLVTGVPDTNQGGADGSVGKFGQICFLNQNCSNVTGPGNPTGNGTAVVTAGGPGSVNFVPDNIEPLNSADPTLHRRARYYDVTLRKAGTTTLDRAATIDVMKLDHSGAKLDIASTGTLNTWADFTQYKGWTNVDGALNTSEMLVVTGLLSGKGTINPDFLTVAAGVVAPGGGDKIGTLTVNSDVVLASASALFLDVSRSGSDKLVVGGALALNGGSVVFNKVTDAPAPRHGDIFTIATAGGGIDGMFGNVSSFQGVLRPELTYGANDITAELRAGSLVTILEGQDATAIAFAGALDQLRSTSYGQLYGLYGAVDLMGTQQLSATLNSLTPKIAGEAADLQDRQSRVMLTAITDRLSNLGATAATGGFSIVGSPNAFGLVQGTPSNQQLFAGMVPGATTARMLPKGMSGFVSGGLVAHSAGYGENSSPIQAQRSSHVSMGLETQVSDHLTVGTAFGYASGSSAPGTDRTDAKTTQMAVYGSYQLKDGAYVAGVASADTSRADMQRQVSTGDAAFDLHGATNSARYNLMAEAGVNMGLIQGLTLTPRAQLAYGRYQLGGFRENGGEVALRVDNLRLEQIEARMGAKLAGSRALGSGWAFAPQLQVDYVQVVSGANDGMKVRFANAAGHAFMLPVAGGDESWAEARGGLRLSNGKYELGAGIETAMGRSDFRNERAVADLTIRF